MSSSVQDWIVRLKEILVHAHDESKAPGIRSYMKTTLPVLGLSVPSLRHLVRVHCMHCETRSSWTNSEILECVWLLWDSEHWTYRSAALEFADYHMNKLQESPNETLDVLERCLMQCEGWTHTDQLGTKLLPALLFVHPSEQSRIQQWRTAESKWVRRAALLWQIPKLRKGEGDLQLLASIIEQYKDDKDFFIQKAIGWTLREAAKGHQDWVIEYVLAHEEIMSNLAQKEALKNVKPSKLTNKRRKAEQPAAQPKRRRAASSRQDVPLK